MSVEKRLLSNGQPAWRVRWRTDGRVEPLQAV